MPIDKLISIVGLILALSIASERLVEIVKGYIPWLNTAAATNDGDGPRRATLQLMAVLAGVTTAWLSRDYIPKEVSDAAHGWAVLGLGLLASGGSGFWNAILSYVLKVKDLKGLQTKAMEGTVKAGGTAPGLDQKASGASLIGGPGLVGATK
jgi:hypothetical protein